MGCSWDQCEGVEEISLTLDYRCYPHGGSLRIDRWAPNHEGYLTTGDNERSNGCRIDQLRATDKNASDQYIRSQGLKDQDGNPVLAVKEDWVFGGSLHGNTMVGINKIADYGGMARCSQLVMDQAEYSSRRHSGRTSDLRCSEGKVRRTSEARWGQGQGRGRIGNCTRLSDPRAFRFSGDSFLGTRTWP